MCRSIKQLRKQDETATDEEIEAAALQFVRKISGFRSPSQANEKAFKQAVSRIASVSQQLLDSVSTPQSRKRKG